MVVAALVGAREHAIKQVEAGVDVLVVAGTEAGGHCREVSAMVLVPEVLQAIEGHNTPVLAAAGIVKGRQMAACMAMGAAGAWTGSMWLTTTEPETSPVIKEKYVQGNSRQTARSQARTGKLLAPASLAVDGRLAIQGGTDAAADAAAVAGGRTGLGAGHQTRRGWPRRRPATGPVVRGPRRWAHELGPDHAPGSLRVHGGFHRGPGAVGGGGGGRLTTSIDPHPAACTETRHAHPPED